MFGEYVGGVGELQPGELARPERSPAMALRAQRQSCRAAALRYHSLQHVGPPGEPPRAQQPQFDHRERGDPASAANGSPAGPAR